MLNEYLDVTNKDLAMLISQILHVSQSRAYSLVQQIRHERKLEHIFKDLLQDPIEKMKKNKAQQMQNPSKP